MRGWILFYSISALFILSLPAPPVQTQIVPIVRYIKIIEPKIISYGTYETYTLTAYTAGVESTSKTPNHPQYGMTASGTQVRQHHTLSCPPELPFGTQIYIPHFNRVYTCEDRGSAITSNRLDIYMKNLDTALKFGRQNLKIFIIPEEE